MPAYLALDQGTTSSRALVFDDRLRELGKAQHEIEQHFPRPGEVEHDAEHVLARTGLPLDPYFSAAKIAWILDRVPGARARAERGELCAATIDAWLVHRLTGGKVFATEPSNASRTALYDLGTGTWSDEL